MTSLQSNENPKKDIHQIKLLRNIRGRNWNRDCFVQLILSSCSCHNWGHYIFSSSIMLVWTHGFGLEACRRISDVRSTKSSENYKHCLPDYQTYPTLITEPLGPLLYSKVWLKPWRYCQSNSLWWLILVVIFPGSGTNWEASLWEHL